MISSEDYRLNRKKFSEKMEDDSVAFFASNLTYPANADAQHPYIPNTDLLYLSGISQENTFLIIAKKNERVEEYLFIEKYDELKVLWDGYMLSKEDAVQISGVENILYHDQLHSFSASFVLNYKHIYIVTNEHLRNTVFEATGNSKLVKSLKENFPAHQFLRAAPILHSIRSKKDPAEIEVLSKSCEIASETFLELLDFIRPGVNEFEIQAHILYNFMKRGAKGESFPPIIGSGKNSCTLHYIANNQICKTGDIVLMDFGCLYENYCSDMTRVVPVNGKFSQRQKAIYNAVLRVHRQANEILKPGILLNDYHTTVGKFMEKELVDLKLISMDDIKKQDPKNPAYKKYFMHGTSHFIGLDVHNYGRWDMPVEENMVFTIEPGIYVPEEKIGVRLENCYVIQDRKKNRDLMEKAPLNIDDIEDIMN